MQAWWLGESPLPTLRKHDHSLRESPHLSQDLGRSVSRALGWARASRPLRLRCRSRATPKERTWPAYRSKEDRLSGLCSLIPRSEPGDSEGGEQRPCTKSPQRSTSTPFAEPIPRRSGTCYKEQTSPWFQPSQGKKPGQLGSNGPHRSKREGQKGSRSQSLGGEVSILCSGHGETLNLPA